MIKAHDRATIERARTELTTRHKHRIEPAEFDRAVTAWGNADGIETLCPKGCGRLIDWCILQGFRTRRRPINTLATCGLLEDRRCALGISIFEYTTLLTSVGGCLAEGDGHQLLHVLVRLERRGLDVPAFHQARREVTSAQVRLVHAARKQTDVANDLFLMSLQEFGGVNSPADLDRRGFDLLMLWFETWGFKRDEHLSTKPAFGERPGFATPRQIQLIRTLWAEWSGAEDDAALNGWLERFHKVSNLRFLTAIGANKAITALRAMKRRDAGARKRSA